MKALMTLCIIIILTSLSSAQPIWNIQNSGTSNPCVDVCFINENNGWISAGYPVVLHTTNGGVNWTQALVPDEPYVSVYFTDLQNGWLGTNNGKIMHTSDGGQTWNLQYKGSLYEYINDIFFINPDTGWTAGGDPPIFPNDIPDRIIHVTTDGGNTWNLQYYQQYEGMLDKVFFTDPNNGYALVGAYLMHTTNGGNDWTQSVITGKIFNGIYFINNNTGWLAGKTSTSNYSGLIYKTTNGGNVWNGTVFGYNENLTDIYFTDDLHGWAVGSNDSDGSGLIYYTSDGGNNWALQNIPAVNSLHSVFFVNNNTGWAVGDSGTIISSYNPLPVELTSFNANVESNNVNLTWQTATETNNKGFEVERLKDSKNTKLQDWNIIGFVNGKGTTTKENNYSFVDKNLKSGNYSYKLVQIDFDGSRNESKIVNVEINSVPGNISLLQNYPNPFNPSTTIEYSIQKNVFVELKIYNVIGQEIKTLVNAMRKPGTYKLKFNASSLPSGIYYYKINAGNFVQTRKMILLK